MISLFPIPQRQWYDDSVLVALSPLLVILSVCLFAPVTTPISAQVNLVEANTLHPAYYEQTEAHFGSVMVTADFDGDGYRDVAVGTPDYDYDTHQDAGMLAIYHGSPSGLQLRFVDVGKAASENLGAALAASDLQNIGHADWLAVGVPGDDLRFDRIDGGAVRLYQYASGWHYRLTWRQGVDFVLGGYRSYANFGATIVSGDFNGDNRGDFAVGAPNRDIYDHESDTFVEEAGSVNLFISNVSVPGTPRLSTFKTELTVSNGVTRAEENAHFGAALAVADFDGDGNDDLAIGVPDGDVGALADAGRVYVDYAIGSFNDVVYDNDVGDSIEAGDRFGAALEAGDFDLGLLCFVLDSCRPDLAIGVPGESSGAGRLAVVYGATDGLNYSDRQNFYQHNVTNYTSGEAGDGFGSVLHAANIDARLGVDLIVGVPDEDWISTTNQGIVHLIFGGETGLLSHPTVNIVAESGTTSVLGSANDRLGAAVVAGDFYGKGRLDLAVGIPGRTTTYSGIVLGGGSLQRPGSGVMLVFSGPEIFSDDFESGNTTGWSSTSP